MDSGGRAAGYAENEIIPFSHQAGDYILIRRGDEFPPLLIFARIRRSSFLSLARFSRVF